MNDIYTTLINHRMKGQYGTVPAKELSCPLRMETPPATRCDAAKPRWTTIKTMGLWLWWYAICLDKGRLEPCLGRRWIAVCLPLSQGFEKFDAPPGDPSLAPKNNLIGKSMDVANLATWSGWPFPFSTDLNQLWTSRLSGGLGEGGSQYIADHLEKFFCIFDGFFKRMTIIVGSNIHQPVFNRISRNDP